MSRLSLTVLLSLLAISKAASTPSSTTISAKIDSAVPSNAVEASPQLISFSLEGDAWPQWAAKAPNFNTRNDFFINALKNLRDRTNAWPNIRVGANSEDRTAFDTMIKVIFHSALDDSL